MTRLLALLSMITILTVSFCLPATAEDHYQVNSKHKPAFLVVMTLTSTGQSVFNFNYHEVDSLEMCFEMVERSRVEIPKDGDAEAAVVLYCSTDKVKRWDYKKMESN
jgi:hypothetical protein